MIMTKLNKFLAEEDGAVTVDWVVLTAAIIGLGLVVIAAIAAGMTNVSTGVGASLNNGTVTELDIPDW
jgi:Flp pilus assembly pilin Flp